MRLFALALATALGAAAVGYWLGDSFTARLSSHAGYHLVEVRDAIGSPPLARPRRAVVVVVDGLRGDAAAVTESMGRLRRRGVCATTYMGPLTVSRPNYAVLSTGLEVDRTGARHNVDTSPLAAESIWAVGREAGLEVAVASHLSWWGELFPRAFDRVAVLPLDRDLLTDTALADLTLLHPLYVDEAGHDHGAGSPAYRVAVARFDAELGRLIDRLDLSRDLLVVTADHGHVARGGHGGDQPEIARVLTCFAGAGVNRGAAVDWIEAVAVAPAIAILAGLRFPRHMRAGDPIDSHLAAAMELADPAQLGAAYLADRGAAIVRFRAANREALDGGPVAHADRAARHRNGFAAIAALVVLALVIASLLRRRRTARGALLSLGWMIATVAAALYLYAAIRGSLDLTSVNTRSGFARASLAIGLSTAALAALVHLIAARDLAQLAGDQMTLIAGLLALHLAHRWVYGAPLGYPLPGPVVLFAPLIGASLLIAHAAVAALVAAVAVVLVWRTGVRAVGEVDEAAEQAAGDDRAEDNRGGGDRGAAGGARALEHPGEPDLAGADAGDRREQTHQHDRRDRRERDDEAGVGADGEGAELDRDGGDQMLEHRQRDDRG